MASREGFSELQCAEVSFEGTREEDLQSDATPTTIAETRKQEETMPKTMMQTEPASTTKTSSKDGNPFAAHSACSDQDPCKRYIFDGIIDCDASDRGAAFDIKTWMQKELRLELNGSSYSPIIELLPDLHGAPLMKGIDNCGKYCKIYILLFTKKSISKGRFKEKNFAIWATREDENIDIIPILFDFEEGELPENFTLKNSHYLHYEPDKAHFKDAMQKILSKHLRSRLLHDAFREECVKSNANSHSDVLKRAVEHLPLSKPNQEERLFEKKQEGACSQNMTHNFSASDPSLLMKGNKENAYLAAGTQPSSLSVNDVQQDATDGPSMFSITPADGKPGLLRTEEQLAPSTKNALTYHARSDANDLDPTQSDSLEALKESKNSYPGQRSGQMSSEKQLALSAVKAPSCITGNGTDAFEKADSPTAQAGPETQNESLCKKASAEALSQTSPECNVNAGSCPEQGSNLQNYSSDASSSTSNAINKTTQKNQDTGADKPQPRSSAQNPTNSLKLSETNKNTQLATNPTENIQDPEQAMDLPVDQPLRTDLQNFGERPELSQSMTSSASGFSELTSTNPVAEKDPPIKATETLNQDSKPPTELPQAEQQTTKTTKPQEVTQPFSLTQNQHAPLIKESSNKAQESKFIERKSTPSVTEALASSGSDIVQTQPQSCRVSDFTPKENTRETQRQVGSGRDGVPVNKGVTRQSIKSAENAGDVATDCEAYLGNQSVDSTHKKGRPKDAASLAKGLTETHESDVKQQTGNHQSKSVSASGGSKLGFWSGQKSQEIKGTSAEDCSHGDDMSSLTCLKSAACATESYQRHPSSTQATNERKDSCDQAATNGQLKFPVQVTRDDNEKDSTVPDICSIDANIPGSLFRDLRYIDEDDEQPGPGSAGKDSNEKEAKASRNSMGEELENKTPTTAKEQGTNTDALSNTTEYTHGAIGVPTSPQNTAATLSQMSANYDLSLQKASTVVLGTYVVHNTTVMRPANAPFDPNASSLPTAPLPEEVHPEDTQRKVIRHDEDFNGRRHSFQEDNGELPEIPDDASQKKRRSKLPGFLCCGTNKK